MSSPSASPMHPPTRVFDASAIPWEATAKPGLWLKTVRNDDRAGTFLGLVRFDASVRSGLHQHQGVATSFVVDGGLTDHHGSVRLHEAGINVRGSTHDAISYQSTVLVSRLEGPVTYPAADTISGVHAGSRLAEVRNLHPDVPPEVNVPVDALPHFPTGIPGVRRQTVFDYADTGSVHRMVQLTLLPGAAFSFEARGLTDFWVRGGAIEVDGQAATANCFVQCQAGAKVAIDCPYGALLIGWAEAREHGDGNLFGF
ncbi:hypothetical protein AB4Z46_16295 [Variovorax sp. M-6]|uniref:cupin domain-containing protein n=1 Tax=Variovorax sp. M-6 TaxID=3233041 RepID=UPI003F95238C